MDLDEAAIATRTDSDWALVATFCELRSKHWSQLVHLGPYEFRSQSTSGTIAVWKWVDGQQLQLGGLTTAFVATLGIARVGGGPSLPWHQSCLAWVGRKANGDYGAQIIAFDGAQDPSEAMIATIPIASTPGEIWTAVGVAGAYLYVFDAANARVLRFYDTDGDVLADTRDSMFSVVVPLGFRRDIYWFTSDDIMLVRAVTNTLRVSDGAAEGVLIKNGQFVYGERDPGPATHPIQVHRSALSGMSRTAIALQKGHSGLVQYAAAATGPWAGISSVVNSTDSFDWIIVPLNAPLPTSGFVRAMDLVTGIPSDLVAIVDDKKPVILRIAPYLPLHGLAKNSTLTLDGAGLDGTLTVEFVTQLDHNVVEIVRILAQSESQLQLLLPDIAASGTLIITKAGQGGGVATIRVHLF